jgi:hypothetical protein
LTQAEDQKRRAGRDAQAEGFVAKALRSTGTSNHEPNLAVIFALFSVETSGQIGFQRGFDAIITP